MKNKSFTDIKSSGSKNKIYKVSGKGAKFSECYEHSKRSTLSVRVEEISA